MRGRAPHIISSVLLWLICLVAAPDPAFALSCSLSISPVIFPSVDVTTGAAQDTTGSVQMHCNGIPANRPLRFCVAISGGTDFDATSRIMDEIRGPGLLRYQLYSDAARTVPWGSWLPPLYGGGYQWDIATSATLQTTATFTTPIFGRILANQQTVPSGIYNATVSATATFASDASLPCPFPGVGTTPVNLFQAAVAVTNSCSVSASNLDFGTIGLLTSNVDATSGITAQCANGAPYNIGLDAGTGPGATVATREMTQGTNTLNYSLYSDPGRRTVWGNTIGVNTVIGTGTGTVQAYTVYGRIPPQTVPGPGSYSDTIVVTLTF